MVGTSRNTVKASKITIYWDNFIKVFNFKNVKTPKKMELSKKL